mmetsp:Transcript_35/g.87  ORF Transcript_35/g.87 Transcript_35/m.87 type:complete len:204 (+) Transcript_35:418-1029(+)
MGQGRRQVRPGLRHRILAAPLGHLLDTLWFGDVVSDGPGPAVPAGNVQRSNRSGQNPRVGIRQGGRKERNAHVFGHSRDVGLWVPHQSADFGLFVRSHQAIPGCRIRKHPAPDSRRLSLLPAQFSGLLRVFARLCIGSQLCGGNAAQRSATAVPGVAQCMPVQQISTDDAQFVVVGTLQTPAQFQGRKFGRLEPERYAGVFPR